jgi:predicted GNAT family acetyltransferase
MSISPLAPSPRTSIPLVARSMSEASVSEPVEHVLHAVTPTDLIGLPSGGLEQVQQVALGCNDAMEVPFDLTEETNRDLRRWSNALYKVIDSDFPPYGACDDYERITAELERRTAKRAQASPSMVREKFRDNALSRRFELFRNGSLAGYVSYTMRAGALRLHRTVITEDFESMGIEGILTRNVILVAHKRRLAAIPYCPVVQGFLRENPQYRQLMHVS